MAKSTTRKNVKKLPWIWMVLAVIALAVPLTIFISGQNTDNRQHAQQVAGNSLLDVKLKSECKDNKQNGKNTFRRAEYICSDGQRGELFNFNNSCEKASAWREKAEKKCQRLTSSNTTSPETITPIFISNYPPTMTCRAETSTVVNPPGEIVIVELLDHKQMPIPKALISWEAKPNLTNSEGFTKTNYTNKNGVVYNFIPVDLKSPGILTVYASYKLPNSNPTSSVSCSVTLHYPTPTPTPRAIIIEGPIFEGPDLPR